MIFSFLQDNEAQATWRSHGGWEQHQASLLDEKDIKSQIQEAARALDILGVDVLTKQEAWDKACWARAQAKTDFHNRKPRTHVWT